jgi:adenylate cyclase
MNGNEIQPGKEERRLAAVLQLNITYPKQKIAADDPRIQNSQDEAMQMLDREAKRQSGHLAIAPRGATLGVFPTARAASDCALEIQKAIRERNRGVSAEYRFHAKIALHLGDLIEEGGQVSGDAVEVTNWVAALADPGGVAMTGVLHTQIKSQIRLKSIRLGTYRFAPNTPRIPVFAVLPAGHSFLLWYLGKRRLRAAILAGGLIAGGITYVAVDQLLHQDLDFDAFSSPSLRWHYAGDGATGRSSPE